ncbi:pilus assembly protein CpaF [Thermanaeromonas toyohensis ToBE]|uniref:Pilus assembly protein CpaF n=1 Tax=Thermanaeromonas toyohensis ToBE TaxID=698762 RepID=A0A1W1VT40_9FIRM|nr:ATPase, T2SS/T4P/T4SS family [Thermanaeromonas toyohensis]SMB96496.1 pilus assembly protein CpaF [Thermanaeromonas toyohensis ToBE]
MNLFLSQQHSLRRRLEEGWKQGGYGEGSPSLSDEELYSLLREPCSRMLRQKFTLQELASWRDPAQGERIRRAMELFVEDFLASYRDDQGRKPEVTMGQRRRVVDRLVSACLGYGPLERFFSDPMVMEVVVVRWDNVWLERGGERIRLPKEECFESEEHCRAVLERMLEGSGRQIDLANPRVDARLPDGSRLKAHIPPVAVDGTTITVRRFRKDITGEKLVELGTVSRELLHWLGECVRGRLNIVVSGGTASGKTTLCNVLAGFIPKHEWLVTIEDPAELQFDHPCVRRLEARPPNTEGKGEVTMLALLMDALRMHPDRIIVGEVRGPEAFLAINAMNTGHDGSLLTLHANSVRDALARMVNMVLMADTGLPYEAIVEQIRSALDLVVHVEQDREFRRRIVEVAEVLGSDAGSPGEFLLQPLWKFDRGSGTWQRVGSLTEAVRSRLARWGVNVE